MSFFRIKKNVYPLFAIVASIAIIVYALVMAKRASCSYFLIGAYFWIMIFGCFRSCLRMLPIYIIVGGLFSALFYLATGVASSALTMANRFGGIFLAVAIGMSVESVTMTRNLSQLRCPRSVTLGMLIATSFTTVLRTEINRVRESMKTRGAGSILNPKIFYRAFLIPFVTRLVKISDTLALSVETRGFALGKVEYTVYKKENIAFSDILFLVGIIVGGTLAVVL
ncbi:MAG: energy-coupling factor transporter transmembrane protein EcfT [Clostridia bacterium]|nr:energy-coupling factor transporter transmembrane protein EcfT [Clostridia bacterium]MDE6759004.1 energy-coupling factor transporter transmembrane protein EcfT [Clostridia bacterium]